VLVEVREVVKGSQFQGRRGVSASNAKGAFREKFSDAGRDMPHLIREARGPKILKKKA
jgi:hypothetical protein